MPSLYETASENDQVALISQLQEAVTALNSTDEEKQYLEESLARLDSYLDVRGWGYGLFGGYDNTGPDLDQLHEASQRVRDMRAMNSHVKRGLDLRNGYIWSGGIHYDWNKIPKDGRNKGGNVYSLIHSPVNQRYFFSQAARDEREAALYCDSQPFIVGDDKDKTLRTIPVSQITGDYRNPEYDDEIWAYRRTWTEVKTNGTPETKNEWIFVNMFIDQRPKERFFKRPGGNEPISQTKRMFGRPVNTNSGWGYGLPDALAGMSWAEKYRQFVLKGQKMSDAMANIWATAKSNTKAGADNVGMVTAARPSDSAGGIASLGASNALTPLATAGQSYSFEKGIDILANFAASINVSLVSLTANPSTAGGSYGASAALDLPEQLTTTSRRQYHIDLDREVLVWLGAPDDIDIWFDPMGEATEIFREIQGLTEKWNTGLYDPAEMKQMIEDISNRRANKVPTGVLIPNNAESLPRRDIDRDGQGSSSANTTPGATPATHVGGTGLDSNDLRTDNI